MQRDADRESENPDDAGTPFYVRSVTRFTNEDGMFRRLRMDLDKIAQEYGFTEDQINEKFMQVNCSKSKLIDLLKG